jgi:hypothetical protein
MPLLVHGISGGLYRHGHQRAFARAYEFTKPSAIPKAMKSMIDSLQGGQEHGKTTLAGIDLLCWQPKYCDRFVNVHPFKDGKWPDVQDDS